MVDILEQSLKKHVHSDFYYRLRCAMQRRERPFHQAGSSNSFPSILYSWLQKAELRFSQVTGQRRKLTKLNLM